jgi:protocatechuate 3,4-dioxygenase beta subunit
MKFCIPALLPFVLVSVTSAQTASRNASATGPKVEDCALSGMVVKLAGSEPLITATVQLQSVQDLARTVSVVTDVAGRFEMKGIEPGRYRLKVSRTGFVTQEYGQKTPNDPGSEIRLSPGQTLRDLLFRLIPWGIIAGRVLDEEGEPLPWAQVSALREVYSGGKRKLSPEALVPTNDLGEYRLFGLKPGRYFISAKFKPGLHIVGRGEVREDREDDVDDSQAEFMPIYYPSSPDPAKASTIALRAGEEIPAIEILFRPVTTYRVRGRVYNMVAGRRSSTRVIVQLEQRNSDVAWGSPDHQTTVENTEGSFEIANVLPGSYTLSAISFEDGRPYQSRQAIEVGNANLEGANLTITPGIAVPGRIVWDGKPSLDRDELLVNLTPVDSKISFNGPARVTGSSFVFKEVFDGAYRLGLIGQSKDCYLKSVRYASSEALAGGFTVLRGAPASLEVTISSRGVRVQGSVTDKDNLPVTGVWVVLVPDETRRDQSRLYQKVATDQYGHYLLRGIAPGSYKVFCWDEVENGAWEDPDFLKTFEDRGQKISVEDADAKTLDIVVIQTKNSE